MYAALAQYYCKQCREELKVSSNQDSDQTKAPSNQTKALETLLKGWENAVETGIDSERMRFEKAGHYCVVCNHKECLIVESLSTTKPRKKRSCDD